MVSCPVCDAELDIEEDELDEGEVLTCNECAAELRVVGLDPLELEPVEEEDDAEFEDEEEDWK